MLASRKFGRYALLAMLCCVFGLNGCLTTSFLRKDNNLDAPTAQQPKPKPAPPAAAKPVEPSPNYPTQSMPQQTQPPQTAPYRSESGYVMPAPMKRTGSESGQTLTSY